MIRDRGNIKWTAMMLPEHVAMLRELQRKNGYKEMPILDEQQLLDMNETIQGALKAGKPVEMTYFENYRHKQLNGFVKDFDQLGKKLKIIVSENDYVFVSIKNIIDIKIAD